MSHEKLLIKIREAMKKTYWRHKYEEHMLFNKVTQAAREEEITIRLRRINKKGSGA
jgi:hypothetical protein